MLGLINPFQAIVKIAKINPATKQVNYHIYQYNPALIVIMQPAKEIYQV